MPYNPRSRKNLVDMPALGAGEQTAVHRVRARKEVHDWLRGMTAEQRGEVLAALYEQQHGARESAVTPDNSRLEPAPELVKVVGKLGLRVLAVMEAGGSLHWEPQPNGDTAAILWHTDGKKQRVSPETVAKLEAAGLAVPSLPK